VRDHIVACEKSADLLAVAQRAAHDNGLTERISFLQKDARNLKAREDAPLHYCTTALLHATCHLHGATDYRLPTTDYLLLTTYYWLLAAGC